VPKRGEVWLVNFDPTVGSEIQKTRPAIVISSDGVGKLPVKLVVPLTEWQASFTGNIWHVRITPDSRNGLTKDSAADTLQTRSVSVDRFVSRWGAVTPVILQEIAAAIAAVVEYL
jgi:mRNA interferase MazF